MNKLILLVVNLFLIAALATLPAQAETFPFQQGAALSYDNNAPDLYLGADNAATSLSSASYGQTVMRDDGVSYTTYGNRTFDNRGNSWTTYGNTVMGSDGSVCTRYGNERFCE